MDSPLKIIYDKIVGPAINGLAHDAIGIVTYVHYEDQTVDVRWVDHRGGVQRNKNVPLPIDGDGFYRQAARIGDRVKIAFVNNNPSSPYVSVVCGNSANQKHYESKNGSGIMKGINYMLGSD